jgi:hypothetical protein
MTVATVGWILVVALTALLMRGRRETGVGEGPVRRYDIVLPDSAPLDFFAPSLYGDGLPALAISPDGETLVYVARRGRTTQLFRRPLRGREVQAIAGTEGAAQPFFSPDGARIGFTAGGEIRAVPAAGGAPVTLAIQPDVYGATWTRENRVVFGNVGPFTGEVAGGGGEVARFSTPAVQFPDGIPGSDAFVGMGLDEVLVTLRRGEAPVHRALGPRSSDSIGTPMTGVYPRATVCGHLVWLVGNTLTAATLDGSNSFAHPPAPIEQGVRRELHSGQFATGPDGTLVFAPGRDGSKGVLVWADRTGRVLDTLDLPEARHFSVSAGPSGWVATSGQTPSGTIVATLINMKQGIERRPSVTGHVEAWWPGGRRAVVVTPSTGLSIAVATDGEVRQDTLVPGWRVLAVSPDGRSLVARDSSQAAWVVSTDSTARGHRIGPAAFSASFSPDGQWVVYVTPEAAARVSPVPPTGETYPVTPPGIDQPEWSPKGDEIFYRIGKRWMTVPVSTKGGVFQAEKPRLLFEGRFLQAQRSYAVGPDGRFLLIQGPSEETTTRLHVVTNFCSELKRLAPPTR